MLCFELQIYSVRRLEWVTGWLYLALLGLPSACLTAYLATSRPTLMEKMSSVFLQTLLHFPCFMDLLPIWGLKILNYIYFVIYIYLIFLLKYTIKKTYWKFTTLELCQYELCPYMRLKDIEHIEGSSCWSFAVLWIMLLKIFCNKPHFAPKDFVH